MMKNVIYIYYKNVDRWWEVTRWLAIPHTQQQQQQQQQ